MTKRRGAWGLALTLCVGLLLGLCGCKSSTQEQAGTTTAGTASTVANDGGTTTAIGAENTTTEQGTSTGKPVEASMTIGEKTIVLDDHTFELGSLAAPLLEYLGEPLEVDPYGCADYGMVTESMKTYKFDHIWVETVYEEGVLEEIIFRILIRDDTYPINGLCVGDTVEKMMEIYPANDGVSLVTQQYPYGIHVWYFSSDKSACWKVILEDELDPLEDMEPLSPDKKIIGISFQLVSHFWE